MAGRIFATKVWGLDADVWGALGFSKAGVRNDLAGEFKPEDFVLYLGTTSLPTKIEYQGKLIALVKVDSTHVYTVDAVEHNAWEKHIAENGGTAKWPHGLPLTEVWEFTDRPLPSETEILPRIRTDGLSMKLAVNYEQLTDEEVSRVLLLPRRKLENVYTSEAIKAARIRQAVRAGLRSTANSSGPSPSLGERVAGHISQPSSLYCLELVGRAIALEAAGLAVRTSKSRIYKIGWAISPEARRDALNFAYPSPNHLGWQIVRQQRRDSQIDAYRLEQAVLKQLQNCKLPGKAEIVSCTEMDLDIAIAASLRQSSAAGIEEREEFARGLIESGLEEGS